MLCIPLGTTFELLPVSSFSLHSMVHAQILHLHILGDFALVELNKKGKDYKLWPHRKIEKDYMNLYIIPPKLIRIPRPRNIIAIHIF
jgi:hypothetical protein